MILRLVPVALLLGTSSALAFDTSKLSQFGSLPLDDLTPVIAKSARLQQEIKEALSKGNKKQEDVICIGMRFPGQWKNLGGLRVSPYACDFGAKWLQIHATVRSFVCGKLTRHTLASGMITEEEPRALGQD